MRFTSKKVWQQARQTLVKTIQRTHGEDLDIVNALEKHRLDAIQHKTDWANAPEAEKDAIRKEQSKQRKRRYKARKEMIH